ncbi:MAG TPA: CCA tRNA nucleotidyltransferase [Terriglobales bacterium]|nr:CCA tRNA nucleotidyltransferase [Terriglobales bacterium]
MADYIYMMESRLTPDQQRGVALVQELARAQEMNIYLTGGAIRDIISGFPIRDLDFTVQGNALKLQRDLEKAGAVLQGVDEDLRSMYVLLPSNVRSEIAMARAERYEKPGRPPEIASGTISDDLRRRDFTINAMALSLNPGSRGLLLDPFNGVADIEAKLIRILHNYAFYEEPSRLIRATRFTTRFHFALEERTQARFAAAREGNYIDNISDRAVGYEIEQIAYEDDPLHILRVYEKEGWLKVLNPHWSASKVDTASLSQLLKTKQQMQELGYTLDAAPAVMYFLTHRLGDRDIAAMQRLMPRKSFVETWRKLEDDAKELARRLTGKEAATPSLAWKLLSGARPGTILFLETTTRHQGVAQKIRNFFTKWRQMKDKLPLPEMAELHITPELPVYPKLAEDTFYLLLDGKLRSRTETLKFLKPFAPPPPPPPPPLKRGRGPKAAEAAPAPADAKHGKKGKSAEPVAEAVAAQGKQAVQKPTHPAPPAVKKAAAKPAPKKAPAARAKPQPRKKSSKRKKK